MSSTPLAWTSEQLKGDVALSEGLFRSERLTGSDAWVIQYQAARKKFKSLFQVLGNLSPDGMTDQNLAAAYGANLGQALRYLAGPPIQRA